MGLRKAIRFVAKKCKLDEDTFENTLFWYSVASPTLWAVGIPVFSAGTLLGFISMPSVAKFSALVCLPLGILLLPVTLSISLPIDAVKFVISPVAMPLLYMYLKK